MWSTTFTREYRLELPFVSAGMGFLAFPELVAAVSNAGGLGLLGVAPLPAPAMAQLIETTRSLTPRPFGVDLIVGDSALGPATTPEHIDVCARERVPVVVFFWNLPHRAWIEDLRDAGCRVWMVVGSTEQARSAVGVGVEALIAQGSEAGGHNRSTLGLVTLVPAMVDAVSPVPVLAAGGIVDGRGVAAAFALGAEGVCVGTRLVASKEAHAHPEYKQRIVAAESCDIVRTAIFGPEWPDQPMKVIRNRVVEEWAGRDDRTPPPDGEAPIGKTLLGGQVYPMPRFSAVLPTPDTTGDLEEMCLAAGEGVGLVKEIAPAADIVRGMMDEARVIMGGWLPGRG